MGDDILRREEKYLQKIRNDIEERLYDLLVLHIRDAYVRLRVHCEENEHLRTEFLSLLEDALSSIQDTMSPYNKRFMHRYMLLISNVILQYDTSRQDIKDLKKRIIEDFTHAEADEHGYIPLNYQMNEVRLTYDVGYLAYLVKKYIEQEQWTRALYCFKAVEMIEPDHRSLEQWHGEIWSNLDMTAPSVSRPERPMGTAVALDTNVAYGLMSDDIGEYRFKDRPLLDASSLVGENIVIMTPSVVNELRNHLEFTKVQIRSFCKRHSRFDADALCSTIDKRFNDLVDTYAIKTAGCCDEDIIGSIRAFYLCYIPTLERLFEEKTHRMAISHRLRKLAQRVDMLPEQGDLELLAEVVTLQGEQGRDVGLVSLDKDFTLFSSDIEDAFGVRVYSPSDMG